MPDIRRATPEDAQILAELNQPVLTWHAEAYPDLFRDDTGIPDFTTYFKETIADDAMTVFLTGKTPVGYVHCEVTETPGSVFQHPRRRMTIHAIAVDPEYRGQGHGQALMASALEHAAAHDCNDIILTSWARNEGAHAFFRTMGFGVDRLTFRRSERTPLA